MKIAVAVSGGVDSLFALYSLKKQGHDVFALHGRFLDKAYELDLLEKYCKEWGIPFYIEDLREEFQKKVVLPFVEAHGNLETPNPCVHCNREVKFGLLFEIAQKYGASHIATGHYVAKEDTEYGALLKKACDQTKDQCYFLALVPQDMLEKAIFPLADIEKDEVRKILALEGIEVPIPKESQEICFVPNDAHTFFVEEEAKKFYIELPEGGRVELISQDEEEVEQFRKRKHKHKGLWHYTEGQRKGLGISWSEPIYVIKRDSRENILYVGEKKYLKQISCKAKDINFFVPFEKWQSFDEEQEKTENGLHQFEMYRENRYGEQVFQEGCQVFVRTRFRQKMLLAQAFYKKSINQLEIFFEKSNEADMLTARGQILAVYSKSGLLLGGGILI